jgi:type IV secretion system protein TrbL
MACAPLDFGCIGGELVSKATQDGLQQLANSILEGVGAVTASLGTFWAFLPTPNLTGGGGDSIDLSDQAPPLSDNILQILNWVVWISISVAIISLILAWVAFGMRRRTNDASRAAGKIGIILLAVVGISAASALVAAVLPSAASPDASGPVGFIQNSLWWYTGALAVLSIIIGCARMVYQQRAEPAKDTLRALATLLLVSTTGVLAIGMLTAAMDAAAVWILQNSVAGCDVTSTQETCFGENISVMLGFAMSSGLGVIAVIVLGGVAILLGYLQLILMIIRGGMLVLLAGIFPISASFTNTDIGLNWFKKLIGWLLAFILYKPAAAIVYATAFQLVGTSAFKDDGSGLIAILTGLSLMAMALVALIALMKFIAPMVAQAGGGGGAMAGLALAGAAGGALGELATGAARSWGGGSGGGGGGSGSGSSSSQASGSAPTGGGKPGGGSPTGGQSPASAGAGKGAGAAGGGSAAGGGAAASGGAASGAAAAAGPIGAGVMAAQAIGDKAKEIGQAAAGAARAAAEDTTGTGSQQ